MTTSMTDRRHNPIERCSRCNRLLQAPVRSYALNTYLAVLKAIFGVGFATSDRGSPVFERGNPWIKRWHSDISSPGRTVDRPRRILPSSHVREGPSPWRGVCASATSRIPGASSLGPFAFTLANHDLIQAEVYVLHPKPQALHQSQARAVQETGHQPQRAVQLGKHCLRFFLAEHDR